MFPLAAGIVPEKNFRAVVDAVKERKMSVGMVSVRILPEALGKAGEGAHLLELYTNTSWDGWARTVSLGGTMTWEDWNANTNGNSMSHPWGAIGLLGIQHYILGVTVLKPQHELIQVKPLDFEGKLAHAEGILPTDKGDISVNWTRGSGRYQLSVTMPVNVKANVYLPKSGIAGNKVKVDGVVATAKEDGDYVYLENIGSGLHTFTRE
jgi:alpha-L-rhamnosidase